ncbi:ATP-dependent helicase [Microvirga sp. SRT01]|uniref:DNA 3'-5' helicase n=1 Tax=Sphingomonas longa TaxID=2778730 RepID=A0ABS2DAE4_9SPHN|nr:MULTISPECIES: ATP-dependent helicase [Alphaproteobacteria]MBM6577858.1 ATP-dependent helicase [Sphingomonas sp. BT552]MBR7710899.1 ATP-dependent helicase [Microvirga sp. SRT01]
MLDLTTLNENQLAAVQWNDGPLLVLAGPGSGKTRVLAYRLARLIDETSDRHFKVLALTFTNKAAAEMRERVSDLLKGSLQRTLLTTFHSFAADLVRQHGQHVGLRPDFTMLVEDGDRHSLLEEAINELQDISVRDKLSSERLLPLVNRLTENDIKPETASTTLLAGGVQEPESLGLVYKSYRRLMIERNALDFPGLMAEALNLLETRPNVKKQVQRIYPYVCIDEFQDTNMTQYKILCHIVNSQSKNLFAVADDDQIIYQWNGASPDRLRALEKDFNVSTIQLPDNYRCPPQVVALANKLIAHNFERSEGKLQLRAHRPQTDNEVVRVRQFDTFASEASWVAADIAAKSESYRGNCAILARTRKALEGVIRALDAEGISGYLGARKNEFESAPLQWLHSILRLANARGSRECLRKANKAFFSLEGVDLNTGDVISAASTMGGDYLRAWIAAVLARDHISTDTRRLVDGPIRNLADRLDFWGFITAAFEWLDALPNSAAAQDGTFDDYPDEKGTWSNLSQEICAQYGRDEVTLHLLLQELDLRSKSALPQAGAIPCFTIHASKGLEFAHVYLVAMIEDQLPSWSAVKKGSSSKEMQEERRNCFVAITRTQETLTMSYAARMDGWSKSPSRFLSEMGAL